MNLTLPTLQAQPPGGQVDPLAQLNDIILPEQLHSYVIAPGWMLVALLIIVLILGLFFAWQWYDFKRRFKKMALKELNQWHQDNKQADVTIDNLRYLNSLIKRYTITETGRARIANLFGDRWQTFLVETGNIDENYAHCFAHSQYKNDINLNESLDDFVHQCQRFIKTYNPKQLSESTPKEVANA